MNVPSPVVISEQLVRDCIKIEGASGSAQETTAERKRTMELGDVTTLLFSYRDIARIDNLKGLGNLTKLQLDNNGIRTIENLDSLVNLRWLDLSFNRIEKIEGVDALSQLTDLSLFNNRIETIENMDSLVNLNVLSIGNNQLRVLENTLYLRQFKNLRLVNLDGNPICEEAEYRSYVLSHVKGLKYLDYRLVDKDAVFSAREQHQDDMLELEEKDEQDEMSEKAAEELREHEKLMAQANLSGIEQLFEAMMSEDLEVKRLKQVPELLDATPDYRDKFGAAVEDFKTMMLEQHQLKRDERRSWQSTVDTLLEGKDGEARAMVVEFDRSKKHVFRRVQADPSVAEHELKQPREENRALQQRLMLLEMETVEALTDLISELDRNLGELVDVNKGHFATFFNAIRELENSFFEATTVKAMTLIERHNAADGNGGVAEMMMNDGEEIGEDARQLLADKDALLNAIQASHDFHTAHIDALEDRITQAEGRRFNEEMAEIKAWHHQRDRDRVSEIGMLCERNAEQVENTAAQALISGQAMGGNGIVSNLKMAV